MWRPNSKFNRKVLLQVGHVGGISIGGSVAGGIDRLDVAADLTGAEMGPTGATATRSLARRFSTSSQQSARCIMVRSNRLTLGVTDWSSLTSRPHPWQPNSSPASCPPCPRSFSSAIRLSSGAAHVLVFSLCSVRWTISASVDGKLFPHLK